jgi:hypothetical protein
MSNVNVSMEEGADVLQLVDEAAKTPPPPAWPRVVQLAYPVEFGKGSVIAQIEFRRGRAEDMKGISIGGTVPAKDLMLIASRLSGQPLRVIELLDMVDAGEAMSIALDFYEKCLVGGKKLSR